MTEIKDFVRVRPAWTKLLTVEQFTRDGILSAADTALNYGITVGVIDGIIQTDAISGVGDQKAIFNLLKRHGEPCSYSGVNEDIEYEDDAVWSPITFILDEGAISLSINSDKKGAQINYRLYSNSSNRTMELIAELRTLVKREVSKRNKVYCVAESGQGLTLLQLGFINTPLEKGNYTPDVVVAFEHIVSDLLNRDPCGRLVILNGCPGTGKTYLIQALLNELDDKLFIIVPPSLMPELGGPSFIKLLRDCIGTPKEGTGIVLVVEDADEILRTREGGSTNPISACLNLSDGILGKLLDIRVVATTNIATDFIDAAALRSGRLCSRVDVGPLPRTQAEAVFERITGSPSGQMEKHVTLADVYGMSKHRLKAEKKRNTSAGF